MDDFNNAIKRDISMVKGDTMAFGFQLVGLGADLRPSAITFACKADLADETYIFKKELEDGIEFAGYDAGTDTLTVAVRVAPEDTNSADVGRYFYDLSIVIGDDDDVLTLMKGRCSIEWEVNDYAES